MNNKRSARIAYDVLRDALHCLHNLEDNDGGSRELTEAIKQLETAMMWYNKHRANEGYLSRSSTHV